MYEYHGMSLLIFSSGENKYACHAKDIERVMRVVEITPVANSPFCLLGIFNLHSKTLPVISLRRLFLLDEKNIELEDMLLILHVGKRLVALLTDSVVGVYDCVKDEAMNSDEMFPHLIPEEIVQWDDMLVPIVNLEKMIDEEIFHHVESHLKNKTKIALNV
jgi:purine-binding chemotaxis protein CheW